MIMVDESDVTRLCESHQDHDKERVILWCRVSPTKSHSTNATKTPTKQVGDDDQEEESNDSNNIRSPIRRGSTIHAIHPQMVINRLKPIQDDFLQYMGSHHHSISSLSFSVNDAAGGKRFEECYEKQEVLGEGGFATVYRCFHLERMHTYAVKEIQKQNYECSGENLREEIDALKRLRDIPYIVRLFDVFHEPNYCYMVMEEMRGGDLLERICEKEVFEEPEARKISRRLLDAVYYCHKKHIVHRDIKPENILLTTKDNDTSIKLADFGCARRFAPGTADLVTLCGSPQYVAPELYTHNGGYDERCDIWSCGIVIYVILGGYAPFDAEDHELPKLICEGHFEFHPKYWDDVSQRAKDLIKSLITVNPDRRATIEAALSSEWLRRRDKDTMKKSNMDGSMTNFEAWCHSQHSCCSGSSSGKSMSIKEENSNSSLQPDELL